jgi:hypothetical protein
MDTKQSGQPFSCIPRFSTQTISTLGDVPPLYHTSIDGTNSPPLGDIPPEYDMTVAPRRVHHSYTLERGTKTWLTFELESRAPSADSPPYFFGHAPISGRIVLDLDRPEYITSIAIKVCRVSYRLRARSLARARSRADGLDASRSGLE